MRFKLKAWGKNIYNLFNGITPAEVKTRISMENIKMLNKISIIVFATEFVTFSLYLWANRNGNIDRRIVVNVSTCMAICLVIQFATNWMKKRFVKTSKVSNLAVTSVVVAFYLGFTIWSFLVDVPHYMNGEQMLTFYIVQFISFSFLLISPQLNVLLVVSMFIILFVILSRIDGAAMMSPQNHFMFAAIAVLAEALQYQTNVKLIKNQLETSKMNDSLLYEVKYDDLTNIKNRYALRVDAKGFIGTAIHVAMIDIDFFKKYNDTYGHLTGDEVIRRIATSLQEQFVGTQAYRFGGDEFLLVYPNVNEEEFLSDVRKWKEAVAAIKIEGVPKQITCSLGYVSGTPKSEEEFRVLLKEADEKLYQQKALRKIDR